MRQRADGPGVRTTALPHIAPASSDGPPDPAAVGELFSAVFRRDLLSFFPRMSFEVLPGEDDGLGPQAGPGFCFEGPPSESGITYRLFGSRQRLCMRNGGRLNPLDIQLIEAVAAVLTQRYVHLFEAYHPERLDLYRGGSEDHYVAAFIDPGAYRRGASRVSRIATTIQTLRTAALSTYENRRVSTGALLMGEGTRAGGRANPTPTDAIEYRAELTSIHGIHRLCDGRRTLFLVDPAGRLVDIIDVARWANDSKTSGSSEAHCARAYHAHAVATRHGDVCLVLSPNQEIKLFAAGRQAFAFSHGRWRVLDSASCYATWSGAVSSPAVARVLFQAALDMAEDRHGGLFVVLRNPEAAIGRLIARHDLLDNQGARPDAAATGVPHEPSLPERGSVALHALHYLARGRTVGDLDTPVLEAIASVDGALVTNASGRILAFGAILRNHDAPEILGLSRAEGARTTAALVASLYGPVLKVSEDGIVSFFLDGRCVWDL